jgi:hypothetical protein
MAYTIYNTDGSVLLTLGEGKIDEKNTSITLIGKNIPSYGEYFNNNQVKMLANFSGTDEPRSPLVGQLWYDTASGRMKVYDLNSIFRPITNTLSADTQPVELAGNDFWWDTHNEQLKFTPDGQVLYTIGPVDSSAFGTTGWIAESINDDSGNPHTITSLYNGGQRVGILSTDAFTFAASTSGMTSVSIGLNLNTSIAGIKFVGTATSADSINGLNVNTFIRNDINQTTLGSLTVKNNLGFVVSNSVLDTLTIAADTSTHIGTISYNSTNKNFRLQVINGVDGLTSFIYANSQNKNLGIWTESPVYPLDVNGNTRIQGNLIVQGTTTTISSSNLRIADKNIELAVDQATPADSYATGGGLTLHGTTDHIVSWKNNGTGWNFNDNANLVADPITYTGVSAVGNTGADALFNVVKTDGVYSVIVNNSGTGYTSATSIVNWTTSGASTFVSNWTTSTPYVNNWHTGTYTYVNVGGIASGTGTGATADITIRSNLTYAIFTARNPGINYQANEIITVYGTSLGGTSPTNDCIITVTSIGAGGTISGFTVAGTSTWTTSTPFTVWTTTTPFNGVWSTTTAITIQNTNLLTITGNYLGGTTPTNDLQLRVANIGTGGTITGITYSGTATTWGYKVSGSTVLTRTSLGQGVISAPGLATVGIMSYLTVTNVEIRGNTIKTVATNQTLYLDANGTGNIDVSNNKITSVSTGTARLDAANIGYVDDAFYKATRGSFGLTLDVTRFVEEYGTVDNGVKNYLDLIHPISNSVPDNIYDIPDGARAKVLCATVSIPTNTATITFSPTTNISVDKAGIQESASVVSGDPGSIAATLQPQSYIPVTTYEIQTWKVVFGTWQKQ